MSTAKPPAFAVRDLSKRYDLVAAIENVSFTVPLGTAAALVGPPGAGKTTILRILLGLLAPTTGSVEVGGSGSVRPTGAVGGMLDSRGLHPLRSARDHLRVYAAAIGVTDERVEQVIDLVGLGDAADVRAAALSTGQQTQAALATALLGDPPLLVLDEPMAGLVGAERVWLQEFLRGHTHRGGTVLLSSESLAAVIPIADSLIVVSEGSITYQGTPAKLRRSHPDRLVVAASTPIALATTLAANGFTDAVIRPDGRLAVAEATAGQIHDAARAAGVRLDSVTPDPIHPDRVLAALTRPTRPQQTLAPYPGVAAQHPTPTPYGIPR
ncbi:ABC transporter ATP-binding protein [Nocardia australiensis]|uniref:ABC transporter ATP-binding protein n=1 Tax=Nocardia australiensis TaxID=2887191 RepID=UPI001D132D2D|nr:ATP-binding cassette domain-containing protein [Nocardia australiensis]